MRGPRLHLTREEVLVYRRRVGGLTERSARTPGSIRRAAWAGLQDSMPRAALLSLHARLDDIDPGAWEDPHLVQLWGPRFSAYAVPARDHAVFSVGRWPDAPEAQQRAEELADRLETLLGDGRMSYAEAGRALGVAPNSLRYATATGRVLIRWDGARKPEIWIVAAPAIEPGKARAELARRYLHVFGPGTPGGLRSWAGLTARSAAAAFEDLRDALIPVTTPIGDASLLAEDEEAMRAEPGPEAPARLLPSGDAYYLLQGADRELLVPDAALRGLLWTSRVWPGALVVGGDVAGTWRRAGAKVTIHPWRSLSQAEHAAVEAEAASLPLPDIDGGVSVIWEG